MKPSKLIFDSSKTKFPDEVLAKRPVTSTPLSTPVSSRSDLGIVPNHPKYKKIMEKQRLFLVSS